VRVERCDAGFRGVGKEDPRHELEQRGARDSRREDGGRGMGPYVHEEIDT
jgi:hypothetical protein